MRLKLWMTVGLLALGLAVLIGCSGTGGTGAQGGGGNGGSGAIQVDGSSTVLPISEAVAEEFQGQSPGVSVTVGSSGTGGGFEKFCNGETAISDASRPIERAEIESCEQSGIEFVEIPVAYDGLSVVVNSENDWADSITVEELNKMWAPEAEGKVDSWNDVRPDWPDRPLSLYGPGTDSGTFDYFTEVINGEEGASRGDYQASEDDNVLVQGIAGDQNALGYFGYAYYEENRDKLKVLAIDGGGGPVRPTPKTIASGEYEPLSRPLFIYVSLQKAEQNPAVAEFVDFYLNNKNLQPLVKDVGFVPLPESVLEAARQRWENRTTGTIYEGGSLPEGQDLESALEQSQ